MSRPRRVLVAALVALVAAIYVLVTPRLYPAYVSDFDQLWIAARAMVHGDDPYAVVKAFWVTHHQPYGLLYPGGAVVMATTMSAFPLPVARAVFVALTSGIFAYVLLRRGWFVYPVLLSASMRASVSGGQIAPIVAASVLVPAFGWVAWYKPNVAIPALVAQRGRRELIVFLLSALALLLLSLLVFPAWPGRWLEALKTGDAVRPLVLQPFGFLLLLALLRWRDPGARWLAVMSLVPVNPKVYDALPLLALLPRTHTQALMLALLTHLTELTGYAFQAHATGWVGVSEVHAKALLYLLYLPALGWLWRRKHASD